MKKVKSVLSCKCQLNGEEKIAKHAGWCILQMAFCRNSEYCSRALTYDLREDQNPPGSISQGTKKIMHLTEFVCEHSQAGFLGTCLFVCLFKGQADRITELRKEPECVTVTHAGE